MSKTEHEATPAGPPRVMVKEPFEPVYEAELLAEGEMFEVRRLSDGERQEVRPTQVWANGFDVVPR